jgi:hypothetical protein
MAIIWQDCERPVLLLRGFDKNEVPPFVDLVFRNKYGNHLASERTHPDRDFVTEHSLGDFALELFLHIISSSFKTLQRLHFPDDLSLMKDSTGTTGDDYGSWKNSTLPLAIS